MNVYQEQFSKYVELSKRKYKSYYELSTKVKSTMLPKNFKPVANAVVVVGFSGNGKSTWVDRFVESNPDYTIISMDEVIFDLFNKLKRNPTPAEIMKEFGDKIDKNCSLQKNVVIDGNFLNLLTRAALIDTVKTYGYQISVVNITNKIMEVLPTRIMDVASEKLNVRLNDQNNANYQNNPIYIDTKKEVIESYLKEREESNIKEQLLLDLLSLGADKVFDEKTPFEEIVKGSSEQR